MEIFQNFLPMLDFYPIVFDTLEVAESTSCLTKIYGIYLMKLVESSNN